MKPLIYTTLVCGLTLALGAGVCCGQEAQPETPPPPPQPQPPDESTGDLPGLDDLLGLPESGGDPGPGAADALRRELADKLAGQQIAEQFEEAVRLMGQTADRMQTTRDTGLATQRLQEDVLKKLDALIDAAKKKNNNSSSSSSKSEQDKRSQPNQPRSSQSQAGQGENRDQVDPPARREGAVNPDVDQTGAAWGSLPAHVREALSQGFADSYSSLYSAMTAAYYRRLAEEAGK